MMATRISSSSSSVIGFLSSALLASFFLVTIFSAADLVSSSSTAGESHDYHHTVQISSLLPASVCSPSSAKGESKSGTLKVVHRHGPCSHLGRDKARAPVPSVTESLTHDQSRVNSIHARLGINAGRNSLQDSKASTLPANTGTALGTGNYIVTVGLGTPKKELSLIFDTGSDLTWTQCQPCAKYCYQQQEPTFNPSLSNTYKNVSCNTAQCYQLSSATGNSPGCATRTCIYGIQYGDSSFSVGYFGTETLTLTSTDAFPNFFFGCGENNRGLFGGAAGLLGLGRDQLSIVSQTASKYGRYFSYCLPSRGSSSGYLSFGKGGGSSTSSALNYTPMQTNSQVASFYWVDITAIKVGGQVLSISQSVFTAGGTIVDSGTVITRLPPGAYSALRTAFRQLMTKYPTAQPLSILDTCYDFSNHTTLTIPKISFFFSGNVEVPIDASGILYVGSVSQACLAFAGNSASTDVGIFGNVQQQTLQVDYDVAGGKLGFATGGCS